jgi:squalene-hopene/tetraprenyl-beta-curcumene cyclase
MIETTLPDGTKASRLRAYGSMTYAGFKSYIFANLDRDDPRVTTAYDWIRRNYTLQENPGTGTDGMYYYFVTFARALDAWGLPTIETLAEGGAPVETRDWASDLIARLAELQNPDGSFQVIDDRWMEDNPVLITAYALLALQHAVR